MREMTYETAGNRLSRLADSMNKLATASIRNSETYRNIMAVKMGSECCKIRVPKKVTRIENLDLGVGIFCPSCEYSLKEVTKCCPNCGQTLQWKE